MSPPYDFERDFVLPTAAEIERIQHPVTSVANDPSWTCLICDGQMDMEAIDRVCSSAWDYAMAPHLCSGCRGGLPDSEPWWLRLARWAVR
jgi:hypothetical protein